MAESAADSPSRIGPLEILGDGMVAGLYGASAVAMWFLVVDLWSREPLYTPALVVQTLMEGRMPDAVSIELLQVAAFSALHAMAFIAFGFLCALVTARLRETPDYPLIAIGIFIPLELGFVLTARFVVDPGLAATLGHGYIAVGNVLAAALMALYLYRGQRHRDS